LRLLSADFLDYLPQIDQRGLIAKRNLETHAAGFGNTALTVASTIRPADSRTCKRSPTEYACGWRIVMGEPILPVIALRK
jgi:hypothetical protein